MAKLFVSFQDEKASRFLWRHPENVPRLGERQHQSGCQRRSENSLSSCRQRSGEGSRRQETCERPQHPQLHHPPLVAQDEGTAGPPSVVWAVLFCCLEKLHTYRMEILLFILKGGEPAAAQVDSGRTLQELQQPQTAGARVHRSSGSRLTGDSRPPSPSENSLC